MLKVQQLLLHNLVDVKKMISLLIDDLFSRHCFSCRQDNIITRGFRCIQKYFFCCSSFLSFLSQQKACLENQLTWKVHPASS